MLRSQGDKAGSLVDYITGQMERVYPGDLHRVFAPGGCVATCDHSSFVLQNVNETISKTVGICWYHLKKSQTMETETNLCF